MSNKSTAKCESWPDWIQRLLDYIKAQDWEDAANMLLCNTAGHCTPTPANKAGHDAMFRHPLVLQNALVLWEHMKPHIVRGFVREIKTECKQAGWKLPDLRVVGPYCPFPRMEDENLRTVIPPCNRQRRRRAAG